MFVTGIFPPEIGGPASYIPRIAKELSLRHSVRVITLGDSLKSDGDYSFELHRVPKCSKVKRYWLTVQKIRMLLGDTDVVITNGLYLETALAVNGKRPIIAKVVGDTVWERARSSQAYGISLEDFQKNQGSIKWALLHKLQRKCFKSFSSVFTPSDYLADVVRGWGVDPKRVDVIPNAVERLPIEDLRPEVDLVTVARLVPWKGLVELIDLAVMKNWSLSIVGDGPMREELALQIKASGSNKIFLRGGVPQKQVARELRRGRVFVLNSSYEGLPHIVLEAKSAGVPVVASNAGGTIETINDRKDGRLVPVGKTKQLGLVLGELLGDEQERIKLRNAGYSQIEKEFSLKQMAIKTERLIAQNVS